MATVRSELTFELFGISHSTAQRPCHSARFRLNGCIVRRRASGEALSFFPARWISQSGGRLLPGPNQRRPRRLRNRVFSEWLWPASDAAWFAYACLHARALRQWCTGSWPATSRQHLPWPHPWRLFPWQQWGTHSGLDGKSVLQRQMLSGLCCGCALVRLHGQGRLPPMQFLGLWLETQAVIGPTTIDHPGHLRRK